MPVPQRYSARRDHPSSSIRRSAAFGTTKWTFRRIRQSELQNQDTDDPVNGGARDLLYAHARVCAPVALPDREVGGRLDLKPHIADIGARTFLVDEEGTRYEPSGLAGPYPYEYHRPETDVLDGKIVYWVFFPNRKADRKTPILTSESKFFTLEIEGLGEEPVRSLQWDMPLVYPKLPQRRLYSEAEVEEVATE